LKTGTHSDGWKNLCEENYHEGRMKFYLKLWKGVIASLQHRIKLMWGFIFLPKFWFLYYVAYTYLSIFKSIKKKHKISISLWLGWQFNHCLPPTLILYKTVGFNLRMKKTLILLIVISFFSCFTKKEKKTEYLQHEIPFLNRRINLPKNYISISFTDYKKRYKRKLYRYPFCKS
jgi:hypothetical protein